MVRALQVIFFILFFSTRSVAQKIDSIYTDLYTDSLKKGTYNYINIDGKLPSGKYIPLDTSQITFTSSDGKFYGNSLWIEPAFDKESITITAALKSNPSLSKQFTMHIKKKPDDERLKTLDEIMHEGNTNPKASKKKH